MRMENGTYKPSSAPYGYKLEDGDLIVLPDEAEQVRKVYELYLSGMGEKAIVKYMQTHETGGLQWSMKQVSYLLTNERYVGDLLMRKYYTPPMLPLRAKKNRGEEDMFAFWSEVFKSLIDKRNIAAVRLNKMKVKPSSLIVYLWISFGTIVFVTFVFTFNPDNIFPLIFFHMTNDIGYKCILLKKFSFLFVKKV